MSVVEQSDKHIAPHHGLKTVGGGNFRHFFQVFEHDVRRVIIAVLVQIFAAPQVMRLVHAYVYSPANKSVFERRKHFVDELVRLFAARQNYIVYIVDIGVFVPSENLIQVRQRLDAGHDVYIELRCIRDDFLQFAGGISAAHISEHRFVVYFVGIFGVKLQLIISHYCEI